MLDLQIGAADIVNLFVGRIVADQVSGLVDTVEEAIVDRVLDEGLCCLQRIIVVAKADARSAETELAHFAGRRLPIRVVDDDV